MKSLEIKGTKRKETGKSAAKKYRNQGLVPCEVYGGKENIHFLVEERAFKKLVYTPNSYIVELNIDGSIVKAIMKDIQFHPVEDNIIHMDFVQISDDKKVDIRIPVKLTGNSVGVRNGGKLKLFKRTLRVSALPKDLPDEIEVDISSIEIGQSVKIKDLSFSGLELKDPQNAVVVSVMTSRVAKLEEETPGVPGTAAAEGAEKASEEKTEQK